MRMHGKRVGNVMNLVCPGPLVRPPDLVKLRAEHRHLSRTMLRAGVKKNHEQSHEQASYVTIWIHIIQFLHNLFRNRAAVGGGRTSSSRAVRLVSMDRLCLADASHATSCPERHVSYPIPCAYGVSQQGARQIRNQRARTTTHVRTIAQFRDSEIGFGCNPMLQNAQDHGCKAMKI